MKVGEGRVCNVLHFGARNQIVQGFRPCCWSSRTIKMYRFCVLMRVQIHTVNCDSEATK